MSAVTSSTAAWAGSPRLQRYGEEAERFTSELIRFDTSNPTRNADQPAGNETPCAEYLAELFDQAGVAAQVIEAAPGRGNLIARLPGATRSPALLLLSHLDVAPAATPESWSKPPFSGAIEDDVVWGRGAVDCKSLVAMQAATLLYLARERVRLQGDVTLAAVADEKARGPHGTMHLLEDHPDLIEAPFVINEGGGFPLHAGGRLTYLIDTAERGMLWARIHVKGRAGHSAMPAAAKNAAVRAAELAQRLHRHRAKRRVIPLVRALTRDVFLAPAGPLAGLIAALWLDSPLSETLTRLLIPDPVRRAQITAMLRPTFSPNVISATGDQNIVPEKATLTCDCRFLPGQRHDDMLAELRRAGVSGEDVQLEVLHSHEGSESPIDTPLYTALAETLQEMVPEAQVKPFLLPTASDSYLLREHGSIAYGFHPLAPDDGDYVRLVHGTDERLPVRSLHFGTEAMIKAVTRIAT